MLILEKLQEELRMQGSSKSLTQCFDMIVGSGSGSITAATLFCMDDAKGQLRGKDSKIYNTVHAMSEHYFDPLEHYFFRNNQNIEATLSIKQRYLTHELAKIFAQKGLLAMLSTSLCVPVLDSTTYSTRMLSGDTNYTLSLYDALVLANQYFFVPESYAFHSTEQHIHIPQGAKQEHEENTSLKSSQLINASLTARNPTLLAYHYARKEQAINTQYYVLSLGTGMFPPIYPVFDIEQHISYLNIQSHNAMLQQNIQSIPNIQYYRIDGTVSAEQVAQKGNTYESSQQKDIYNISNTSPLEKKEYMLQVFEKTGIRLVHKAIPILRDFVNTLMREGR